jgi:hypothetical protein
MPRRHGGAAREFVDGVRPGRTAGLKTAAVRAPSSRWIRRWCRSSSPSRRS